MSKEALKLALEALEDPHPGVRTALSDALEYRERVKTAITAIKEALALQEYDYKDLYEKEKRKSAMWLAKYEEVAGTAPKAIPMAQPEQEPFGYFQYSIQLDAWVQNRINNKGVAFYTTPPQRKPLTDEEIVEISIKSQEGISPHDDTLRFARAIEAAHGISGEKLNAA